MSWHAFAMAIGARRAYRRPSIELSAAWCDDDGAFAAECRRIWREDLSFFSVYALRGESPRFVLPEQDSVWINYTAQERARRIATAWGVPLDHVKVRP